MHNIAFGLTLGPLHSYLMHWQAPDPLAKRFVPSLRTKGAAENLGSISIGVQKLLLPAELMLSTSRSSISFGRNARQHISMGPGSREDFEQHLQLHISGRVRPVGFL